MYILASFTTPITLFSEWSERSKFIELILKVRDFYANRADVVLGKKPTLRHQLRDLMSGYSISDDQAALLADGYIFYAHLPQFSESRPELANSVIYFHYGDGIEALSNPFTLRQLVNRKQLNPDKLKLRPNAARSLKVIQATFTQMLDLSDQVEVTIIETEENTPHIFTAIWPDGGSLLAKHVLTENSNES